MWIAPGLVAALMLLAPAGPKVCTLTFDDGPRPEFLRQALPLLAQKKVQATFFTVGTQVSAHRDWLQKIHEGGHEIGSHTWSHPQLSKLSADGVRSQLRRTSDLIVEVTGRRPHYVRPPYGDKNRMVRQVIQEFGCEMAIWTLDPRDWEGRATPQRTASRILNGVHQHAVILMHEAQPTLRALPAIIDGLRQKGYTLVTYGELMRIMSGEAAPAEPVISISCGREEAPDTSLAPGFGYALEAGLRAVEPPRWESRQKLSFRLLVPANLHGVVKLRLGGPTDQVQRVTLDGTAVGEFNGAHRMTIAIDEGETADGEVLVEVEGLDGTRAQVTEVLVERNAA